MKWFYYYFCFTKNTIYTHIKFSFFYLIFKHSFLRHTINLYFYEIKNINFLTSALISNYITRNLQIGHTLNKIIFPLMRHLSISHYKLYNGWKIGCFGRFKRKGRASKIWYGKIGVPLNKISANIDYNHEIVRLRNGICSIKIFIAKTYIYTYNI